MIKKPVLLNPWVQWTPERERNIKGYSKIIIIIHIHCKTYPNNINRDNGIKFLMCGCPRSRNTAEDRYSRGPQREQMKGCMEKSPK